MSNRVEELFQSENRQSKGSSKENEQKKSTGLGGDKQTQSTSSYDVLTKKWGAGVLVGITFFLIVVIVALFAVIRILKQKRKAKEYERALKLIPMLIHLPPSTDDIQSGGRDERDVNDEAISQATIMYTIISSTIKKAGLKTHIYGQKYFSFEIVAVDGFVKYYAVVPAVLTETVKQAILTSYPTARLEETEVEDIFSKSGMDSDDTKNIIGQALKVEDTISGGELIMKKDVEYPIMTFQEMKWDAQLALLNAFSKVRNGEGLGLQVMFRPLDSSWSKNAEIKIKT